MQQQNSVIAIAVLALGLCLVVMPARAGDFQVTNAQGDILTVGCSGASVPSGLVSNGVTADFTCAGDLRLNATAVIDATVYTVAHDCNTGKVKGITVTQGSSVGTLSLSSSCGR